MTEINVFFLEDGQFVVDPKTVSAIAEDPVLWHFHSTNAEVGRVVVQFEKSESVFFPGNPRTQGEVTLHNGHGHLVGLAPSLTAPAARADRYKVCAFAGETTKALYEIPFDDPVIIICDP